MTDKMVDVGGRHCRTPGRRRPPTFFFQFADTHTNVVRRRRPECRRVSASVSRRRRRECRPAWPTSAADVGVSVGKLDRQCRRPTLADTQADTQSVTLVM